MSATKLAGLLKSRVEDLCYRLLPGGKKIGNEYRVAGIDGGVGKSLGVCLAGDKAGMWCDFAGGNLKGDLIGLIVQANRCSLHEACNYAENFLNIIKPEHELEKNNKDTKIYIRPTITKSDDKRHIDYLGGRKISKDTIELFKVYSSDYLGGSIFFPSYVENELYRIRFLRIERPNGKKETKPTPNSELCLFGWQALDGTERNIIICEGEIDAMSWYEYGFHALSVPMGVSSVEWIEKEYDRLLRFENIFISFDEDKAGKEGAVKVIERLRKANDVGNLKKITLPYKDCNECLVKGITLEQMSNIVFEAKRCDPAEFEPLISHAEGAWELYYPTKEQEGITLPWEGLEDCFRIKPKQITIWLGINGHGKSSFINEILLHTIAQEERVCVASMEIHPSQLLKYLTLNLSGGETSPSRGYYNKMIDYLRDKIYSFNVLGRVDYKKLIEIFEYANQKYGVNHFLIDSLSRLNVMDDYKKQEDFMDALCLFKMNFNCHVHLIAHPRKSEDETKIPGKMDLKGTGGITDYTDNGFTIWKNVIKGSHEIDKPDAKLLCWKNRHGKWENAVRDFYYHVESRQFFKFDSANPYIEPIIKIEK